jgi:hypothetical protein
MTTRARYHVQQRLRDSLKEERRVHNAEARPGPDGYRAVCMCGLIGEYRSVWVMANADASGHNEGPRRA